MNEFIFEGFETANTTPGPDDCWKCHIRLHARIWKKSTDLCWRCHDELCKKITRNNKRARVKGNEATLTIAQWGKILRNSQGHCTYCQQHFGFDALVIEHRLPIAKGGGTTAENCVPACGYCNAERWIKGVVS